VSNVAVDTSALMSILLSEPGWEKLEAVLLGSRCFISAATRVELEVATMRRIGPHAIPRIAGLFQTYNMTIVPLDDEQCRIAVAATSAFGQGRGMPPAVLNFGDLFSYALAKARDLPLVCTGADFAATDLRIAVA